MLRNVDEGENRNINVLGQKMMAKNDGFCGL
jgi:hypothetical protein